VHVQGCFRSRSPSCVNDPMCFPSNDTRGFNPRARSWPSHQRRTSKRRRGFDGKKISEQGGKSHAALEPKTQLAFFCDAVDGDCDLLTCDALAAWAFLWPHGRARCGFNLVTVTAELCPVQRGSEEERIPNSAMRASADRIECPGGEADVQGLLHRPCLHQRMSPSLRQSCWLAG
jgi:hypothetical protein